MLTEEETFNKDRIVVGGLHEADFVWAAHQYEELGYVFLAFLLDSDRYHWKAVYVNTEQLEKPVEVNIRIVTGEVS